MAFLTPIKFAVGTLIVLIVARLVLSTRKRANLPPGPSGWPIFGAIGDLPPPGEPEYKHWTSFKGKYGPISSITVTGQTIILLNDLKIATELLEKQALNYSSRPLMHFACISCGWKTWPLFQGLTSQLRATRRDVHSVAGTTSSLKRALVYQDEEQTKFLVRMARDPGSWKPNVSKAIAAVILYIGYGYRAEPEGEDPLTALNERATTAFNEAATPGKWLVDVMTWLDYIPEWMLGGGYKKMGRGFQRDVDDSATTGLRFTAARLAQGRSEACLISDLLTQENISDDEHERIRRTGSSLVIGGTETSISALSFFLGFMLSHPEIQRKAQDEIDSVLGTQSIPQVEDRPRLPYVEAVWKEVLRYQPPAPLALPHTATEDRYFEGMLIPKGAMLLPNVWGFLHDPETYRDPERFNPERFLGPKAEPDPLGSIFGFGRRICPGRGLADQGGWLFVAKILSVFDVVPAAGVEVDRAALFPKAESGVISHPDLAPLELRPRSHEHAERLAALGEKFAGEKGDGAEVKRIMREIL